jgi:hypothetical protein
MRCRQPLCPSAPELVFIPQDQQQPLQPVASAKPPAAHVLYIDYHTWQIQLLFSAESIRLGGDGVNVGHIFLRYRHPYVASKGLPKGWLAADDFCAMLAASAGKKPGSVKLTPEQPYIPAVWDRSRLDWVDLRTPESAPLRFLYWRSFPM